MQYSWVGLYSSVLPLTVLLMLAGWLLRKSGQSKHGQPPQPASESDLAFQKNRRTFGVMWMLSGFLLFCLSVAVLVTCQLRGLSADLTSNFAVLLVILEVFALLLPILRARRTAKKSALLSKQNDHKEH